jgi:hypothetical protein
MKLDKTNCIMETNSFYPLFFWHERALSPDHISRSQCHGLCHVTQIPRTTYEPGVVVFNSKGGYRRSTRCKGGDLIASRKASSIEMYDNDVGQESATNL